MDAVVEWVDARERLPEPGPPVAGATTGRYPGGEDFWIVLPMHFADRHIAEDGTTYLDCFVDSDGVVRMPYGQAADELVTHWAYLPALPGMASHVLLGEKARAAVRDSLG